jgi:F-box-like
MVSPLGSHTKPPLPDPRPPKKTKSEPEELQAESKELQPIFPNAPALPGEIFVMIFEHLPPLSAREAAAYQRVSRAWRQWTLHSALWKSIPFEYKTHLNEQHLAILKKEWEAFHTNHPRLKEESPTLVASVFHKYAEKYKALFIRIIQNQFEVPRYAACFELMCQEQKDKLFPHAITSDFCYMEASEDWQINLSLEERAVLNTLCNTGLTFGPLEKLDVTIINAAMRLKDQTFISGIDERGSCWLFACYKAHNLYSKTWFTTTESSAQIKEVTDKLEEVGYTPTNPNYDPPMAEEGGKGISFSWQKAKQKAKTAIQIVDINGAPAHITRTVDDREKFKSNEKAWRERLQELTRRGTAQ